MSGALSRQHRKGSDVGQSALGGGEVEDLKVGRGPEADCRKFSAAGAARGGEEGVGKGQGLFRAEAEGVSPGAA